MVDMLVSHGSICTDPVIKAMRAVDRGFFIDPPKANDPRTSEEVRYLNSPFRNGVQHLSAPSIYGVALEALDLDEGLSFLNVCSGTGYLSAVASQILGTHSVHVAVELRAALVEHAKTRFAALGCTHIDLRHGSCLAIDPSSSMRFQRIYVGAGADEVLPTPNQCSSPLMPRAPPPYPPPLPISPPHPPYPPRLPTSPTHLPYPPPLPTSPNPLPYHTPLPSRPP